MPKKTLPKTLKTILDLYLKSLMADRLPIKQAFLFGSYANGHTHQHSDVDLCIEPVGFNPQDFRSDSAFIQEIKKHGIRLI